MGTPTSLFATIKSALKADEWTFAATKKEIHDHAKEIVSSFPAKMNILRLIDSSSCKLLKTTGILISL